MLYKMITTNESGGILLSILSKYNKPVDMDSLNKAVYILEKVDKITIYEYSDYNIQTNDAPDELIYDLKFLEHMGLIKLEKKDKTLIASLTEFGIKKAKRHELSNEIKLIPKTVCGYLEAMV